MLKECLAGEDFSPGPDNGHGLSALGCSSSKETLDFGFRGTPLLDFLMGSLTGLRLRL